MKWHLLHVCLMFMCTVSILMYENLHEKTFKERIEHLITDCMLKKNDFLRGISTHFKEWRYFSLSKLFCLPFERGSTLKGKNLLQFPWEQVLSFYRLLFGRDLVCRKQTGSYKSYLPCQK